MRAAAGLCVLAALAGCAGRRSASAVRPPEPGLAQFQSYCAACHQYDGQRMGDAPPLAGSPWVQGPPDRLIRIVLGGVRGRMEIAGQTYDREMPGFGQILSDADAAALISFVRARFGASGAPVTPAAVGAVRDASRSRTGYWSVDELLNSK